MARGEARNCFSKNRFRRLAQDAVDAHEVVAVFSAKRKCAVFAVCLFCNQNPWLLSVTSL